jgi:hypothetical protein
MVDWGFLNGRRFTEPFFAETVGQCVRHPADLLFRHQTPLESLGEIVSAQPGLQPAGFIFHMSRCGSTLICQMLASLTRNIVISEAEPIDTILRAHIRDVKITDEQRIQWLHWIVGALGWRRHPEEKHLFIKFDCWHALFLPLIERAFPGVPWVFVYREPLEVLASQCVHRGAQMIPGVLEPAMFGWDRPAVSAMALNEYGARVLAKICEAVLAPIQKGSGRLVNYRQLPGPVWAALMQFWGVEFSPDELRRVTEAAGRNAKNPVLPFEEDSEAKRQRAPEEIRLVARQWLEEVYRQLEARRMEHGFR